MDGLIYLQFINRAIQNIAGRVNLSANAFNIFMAVAESGRNGILQKDLWPLLDYMMNPKQEVEKAVRVLLQQNAIWSNPHGKDRRCRILSLRKQSLYLQCLEEIRSEKMRLGFDADTRFDLMCKQARILACCCGWPWIGVE